ncbi:hypothetical protein A2U01_0030194 [Trifolium medium]|uniref:Uncharacterized protein n=1 Tax=Trifolium medium TaxID=97028 RepID=A0A392PAF0_9FABA|nr:hypothetical protein [Trifolium medium]
MHCGIIGHNVQACNWLKLFEAKVDNRGKKIITIKKEAMNMQYVPKKKDSALPSTFAEVIEVENNQQSNLIGTHEGKKQSEEHETERQQAHESPKIPGKDNGAIPDATDGVIDDSVLQQVTTDDVAGVTVTNQDLDQEAEETDDNSSSVPDM